MPGIEALRAIAAGIVVLHHCWSLGTQPRFAGYWAIEGFGSLGVNLFFLLSGYLLPDYFWRPKGQRPLLPFYVRRVMRIAPAYYANLVLLLLFFVPHAQWFSSRGIRQVIANATFTQYLWPGMSGSFNANGALWTLTIEMALYLAMPLLALAIGRKPFLATAVFMSIGIGWRLMLGLHGTPLFKIWFSSNLSFDRGIGSLFIGRQFIGFLPIFAMGIFVKRLDTTGRLAWFRSKLPALSVRALVLLLLPAVLWLVFIERASMFNHWLWFSLHDHVMAFLALPALLVAATAYVGRETRPMRSLTWVGERSYGLYLWHFPIVLSLYGRGTLTAPAATNLVALRIALILCLSLVFAHMSYVAIERPAQNYGRRMVSWLASQHVSTRQETA
jgi:peptidoglycan/LPS O-acetylase OafA/YrhL